MNTYSAFRVTLGDQIMEMLRVRYEQEDANSYVIDLDGVGVSHPRAAEIPTVDDPFWLDSWRKDYNERRPHSALGNRTPQEFAKFSDQACLV